jgi:hypothetical protein
VISLDFDRGYIVFALRNGLWSVLSLSGQVLILKHKFFISLAAFRKKFKTLLHSEDKIDSINLTIKLLFLWKYDQW